MKAIVFDLETDSTNPDKANLKYYGDYDMDTGEYTLLPYTKNVQIADRIREAKILIGFNIKDYDNKILEKFGVSTKYKIIIDLYKILAPDNYYSKGHKNRLKDINPGLNLKNYKLKTIIEALGLDDEGTKGEFDYNILKKDSWDDKEIKYIEKYHKQDLLLTLKLFNKYREFFKPLEKYLNPKDVEKFKHLSCKSGGVTYKFICHQAGIKEEYRDWDEAKELKKNSKKVEGGHHIHCKYEKVRGNIICRDFTSHYPHIMVMAKLHKENINEAIELNLKLRVDAKTSGDKSTSLALKVPLNSAYGICADPRFKNVYDPHVASETTRIGRELLKRYAKTLDIAGFESLYGFTDSVYVGLPKGLTSEDLEMITKIFVELTRSEFKKPLDSYGLGVDGIYKFIWFINKLDNNYIKVTDKNEIEIKGGIFNKNCPECITETFKQFISPRIIKDLDVDFTKEELSNHVINILKDNPEKSSQVFSTNNLEDYKSKTSINYRISEKYGPGVHSLIPIETDLDIGVGISTTYCSIKEFKENNLSVDDISKDRMMRYLKPFHTTKEEVYDLEVFAQSKTQTKRETGRND